MNYTNTLKRKSNASLLVHRVKSRYAIFKDKYLTWTQFFKILIPILVVLVLLPIVMVYIVDKSYERRIISEEANIPYELRNIVLAYNYEDVSSNKFKSIIDEVNKLYLDKRADNIYVFILDQHNSFLAEDVQKLFKDIPKDNLFINAHATDPISICQSAETNYQLNKFLLLSYREYLIRAGYICNSMEVYVEGYQPDTIKLETKENLFSKTFEDIMKFNFNI